MGGPLLAWFLSALGGTLLTIAGSLVGQVIVALGVGVVTYTGMKASLSWLRDSAITAFIGLPPEVVGILALMKVGTCVSMVFSAILIRASLNGMTSDTVKRWVKK